MLSNLNKELLAAKEIEEIQEAGFEQVVEFEAPLLSDNSKENLSGHSYSFLSENLW